MAKRRKAHLAWHWYQGWGGAGTQTCGAQLSPRAFGSTSCMCPTEQCGPIETHTCQPGAGGPLGQRAKGSRAALPLVSGPLPALPSSLKSLRTPHPRSKPPSAPPSSGVKHNVGTDLGPRGTCWPKEAKQPGCSGAGTGHGVCLPLLAPEGTAPPGRFAGVRGAPVFQRMASVRGRGKGPAGSACRNADAASWAPCGLKPVCLQPGSQVAGLRLSARASRPRTASFPSNP